MKKIFKLALVTAAVCGSLVFTGCTKDLKEDISTLKSDLSKLETGKVATLESQVATLQAAKTNLEAVDANLQKSIAALNDSLKATKNNLQAQIAAKGSSSEVVALQGRVSTLENRVSELQTLSNQNKNDIISINTTIDGLKVAIAKKADSVWVSQTFVTYDSVKVIESNLGALTARVKAVEDAINATGGLKDQLSAVKTTAQAAKDSANSALGKIEGVKLALNDYYKKGEVDGQILGLKSRMDVLGDSVKTNFGSIASLQTKSENLKSDLNKLDSIVKKMIPTTLGGLNYRVDSLKQACMEVDDSLQTAISALYDSLEVVNSRLDALEGKVSSLSGRVTSLSVYPTKTPEVFTFNLGSSFVTNMMRVSFEVEPATMAKTIAENKGDLTLNYCEALSRTDLTKTVQTDVVMKKAAIDTVIYNQTTGVVTVIATGVDNLKDKKEGAYYFSATWSGSDKAGAYTVTSDYVQALKYVGEIDLLGGFKYAYNADTTNIKFVPATSRVDTSSRNFKAAETDSIAPFKDKMVAYDNSGSSAYVRLFLEKDAYTVYELGKVLNHEFEVTARKDYNTPPVSSYSAKGYGTFDVKFYFQTGKGEKMSDYVSKAPYAIDFYAKVDGQDLIDAQKQKVYLTHNAYITPVDRGTFYLGSYNIDWNYETYKAEDRKVEIAPTTPEWGFASTCKVMKKLGNSDLLNYNDWNDIDSTQSYKPIKLSLKGNEYEGKPFDAVKDTIWKQNDTVSYSFAFETTVDTPQGDITVHVIDTIPGSLTQARTVVVKDFYKIILAKYPDAAKSPAKDIYIHGAKDTTYASVLKAAQAKIEEKNCVLTVDGATNIKKYTYQYNSAKDEMTFNIIAGEWGYSAEHNIIFYVADVFGFKYETKVKVYTEAPKFGLGLKSWIAKTDSGYVGTARGAIVGGIYTLEDMYYNKQVEVVNLDSLKKYETVAEGDLIVKFDTVTLKTLYPKADGKIGVAAGKSGVTVNPKDGSLSSDILTWGDYNGRMFKLKAQLYLKKDKVGEPLEYCICTQKPVKYVSNNDINKQRTPKVDLPIKLYENAVVYGVVDGKVVEQNVVKPDGTVSKYVNTYFEYADPKDWTITLNGSTPKSWIENVDYKFDSDKQILTIMGDNLKGELKIVMGTKLHYYLDANIPEEMDLTINVTQN